MKPLYRFLIAIFISLAVAAGAYFWVTGMLDSLYAFRSPLKDQPPAPGERLGPPATRRLVYVLVDGLRYDTSLDTAAMPNLAKLRQAGAQAKMHSRTPSFSEAGYSTLLTGAWPDVNGGPAMNLDYADIPTWTQDNLFSAAARAGMKTAISGYYWFEKLVPQKAVSAHFYTPGEDATADQEVMKAALPWLDDPQAYQLILIHLDQVDYAGHHQGGPRNPNWTAAAQRSDAMIGEVLGKLDLSQDTVLITSDHGHVDRGGHGGQDAVVLVEPFVLAGAGVRPGNYGDIQMVDLSPTMSALLGLNMPASAQGLAHPGMLSLPEASAARLPGLELLQLERMVIGYGAAIQEPVSHPASQDPISWQSALAAAQSARLNRERIPRGILAVVILIGLGWLAARLGGKRILNFVVGAAIYLLVFNLRYAVIDGLTYSFSSVTGATDLIIYCGVTAAAGLLAGWLVYALMSRLFRAGPGKIAWETLMFGFAVMAVLAIPVLVNFTLNGIAVAWILPEPASFFVGMLALVQGLFVAVVGLAMTGIGALVAWVARQGSRKTAAVPAFAEGSDD